MSPMTPAGDDLSHDPHLRAALRHAPDHALAPPAGVSQTILNAARHVHKPARPAATPAPAVRITVAPPRPIAWLRQWFASPRLAGGLATGLVAALGLGLWIDLAQEPVIERPPVEAAQEVRSSAAVPAAPTAPTPPSDAAAPTARDAQPAAAPAARADAARAKRAARAAEAKVERSAELAPAARQQPAAPPAPTVPERREDSAARESEPALAKSAAPPSAAPPTPAPAPSAEPAPAVAEATTAPRANTQAPVDAQRDAAAKSDLRMSLAAGRAAAVAGARASSAEATGATDAAAAASPAFVLWRRARSEVAAGSARWSWMPPGTPRVAPLDDAGQAWLTRLVQTARGRWIEVAERAGSGDAIEVRWWRDDWPQATLRIEAEGVRWIEHSGRVRYAPLDAAALQRLRTP